MNRKTLESSRNPDRDTQFEPINTPAIAMQAADKPVISIGTKKHPRRSFAPCDRGISGGTPCGYFEPFDGDRLTDIRDRVRDFIATDRTCILYAGLFRGTID